MRGLEKTHLKLGTEFLEVGNKCVIRTQLHLLPELRLDVLADLLWVDKQNCIICGDYRIAKEDGIEVDVGPAQVEQPCDLVEHRDHQRTRLLLLELLAHARELGRVVLAGIFDIEGEYRVPWARRSRWAPD